MRAWKHGYGMIYNLHVHTHTRTRTLVFRGCKLLTSLKNVFSSKNQNGNGIRWFGTALFDFKKNHSSTFSTAAAWFVVCAIWRLFKSHSTSEMRRIKKQNPKAKEKMFRFSPFAKSLKTKPKRNDHPLRNVGVERKSTTAMNSCAES